MKWMACELKLEAKLSVWSFQGFKPHIEVSSAEFQRPKSYHWAQREGCILEDATRPFLRLQDGIALHAKCTVS